MQIDHVKHGNRVAGRNKQLKKILIAFIAGALVSGGTLGGLGYFKFKDMNAEQTRLETLVKKQDWRLDNLTESQTRLTTELEGIKAAKEKGFDQTIGALLQAKDNAGIEALYDLGLKALAEKDAPRAYFALAQVHKENPKYKAIAEHYPQAQQAYKKHQQTLFQEKLQDTYLQAFDQQAKSQFAQARANYQAVVQMKPDYKDAQKRLQMVARQLDLRSKTSDLAQKNKWLTATYQLGFNHQANGRYAQAKESYQLIVNDSPGYKDAAKRLQVVIPKVPRPIATAAINPSVGVNCYQIGATFGKCAKDVSGAGCGQLSSTPAACKGSPEFIKGFQSAAGMTPAAPDDEPLNAPVQDDPNSLLKGLSNFLKDM